MNQAREEKECPPIKLVVIVTNAMTGNLLLRGQLLWFQKRGFEVTLISNPGPALEARGLRRFVSRESACAVEFAEDRG